MATQEQQDIFAAQSDEFCEAMLALLDSLTSESEYGDEQNADARIEQYV